jgi:endonuclease-3 related protein
MLYKAYGPQHWWPGESVFEVMVGAVLTQNTAWTNVEKAIANIKRKGLLSPAKLRGLALRRLAALIRPSGYYNIKAKRLHNLLELIMNHYRGSLKRMFETDRAELRRQLLDVNGIGPETADSILLYAAGKPVFVVDAYTKRIFSRHGFIPAAATYHEIQHLFHACLRKDAGLFNEYHALIVRLGKERCRKSMPRCQGCPLEGLQPIPG